MCWQGDVAVYTKAQWRDIFLKQAMNICLIYNTKVSVEIHLPGPLQSNIEDPGAPLGTARVPRGGCRTQVFPPAQLFPLDILLIQLFWSVLHVLVPLLEEGKGDSEEHWCHAIRTFTLCTKSPFSSAELPALQ